MGTADYILGDRAELTPEERAAIRTRAREVQSQSIKLRREATRLRAELHETGGPTPAAALSPRERDVAAVLSTGATTLQMAIALGVAESTVNYHLQNVYRKLGVHSRMAAAAAWQRLLRKESG